MIGAEKYAPSLAEIDLTALSWNLRQVRKGVGRSKILAVVKANAYGHGALEVARYLAAKEKSAGIALLGVAYLDEAIALRKAGIRLPILLMTGCPIDQIPEVVRQELTPVVFDPETLAALGRYAKRRGRSIPIHIKLDTGMGRLGLPVSEALAFIAKAVEEKGIRVEGILTHFAEADLKDHSFAKRQLAEVRKVWKGLREQGMEITYCHLANSAAIMTFDEAHFNLVRPGIMLYGYSPLEGKTKIPLRPMMQVRTRVIALKKVAAGVSISYGRTFVTRRESRIATLSIGYADGYSRRLSNCGVMVAGGRRVPVVGRVCMDMTMIDVTSAPELAVGDWVTVIGEEKGQAVWADELARAAETIPYEILCGIGDRIPKIYKA